MTRMSRASRRWRTVWLLPVCAWLALASPPISSQEGDQPLDPFGLLVALDSRPSFSVLGSGARPAGMGGAFTALADDASAASFNPAGLALLLKPETSLVLDYSSTDNRHAAFFAVEEGEREFFSASSSSFSASDLNFFSFTMPFEVASRNLSVQLSFHRLIDFTVDSRRRLSERPEIGAEPTASFLQEIDQGGDVHTLSLTGAYQVTQRMSVGLSVSRWIGDWDFSTLIDETPFDDEVPSSLRFTQSNRWRGWNTTLGILLRYKYLNVGASWRSPFTGSFRVESALDTSFESPLEPQSSFEGQLDWPSSWTLGLAFKPIETLVVTLDHARFDWDDMIIHGGGQEPINFFNLRPAGTSPLASGNQWRTGAEYTVFYGRNLVAFRGGYFDVPRPRAEVAGTRGSSDTGFSLGVGWKRGPLSFDIAYQRSTNSAAVLEFVDPEDVGGDEGAVRAEGRVDSTEQRIFVSVLYQFQKRANLNRAFQFLFVGPSGDDDGEVEGE